MKRLLILSMGLWLYGEIGQAFAQSNLHVPSGPFYWQLQGDVTPNGKVAVIDSDVFDTSREQVQQWRKQGLYPICYINVGSFEDWREDANSFPKEVIGKSYEDWEGEKWIDISHFEAFASVMTRRFDMCREKGFLAVEPDNIDGYDNDTGYEISVNDQLRYLDWLIAQAHKRGLTIGQKNAPDLAYALVKRMDFALIESSWRDGFMDDFRSYVSQGKPVFAVEYREDGATLSAFCPIARKYGFIGVIAGYELDGLVQNCP